MENEINKKYCQNCYAPLKPHTKYCGSCGQKHSTKYVTFWQLISEGFSSLFNLDSRIFRTIFALFQPGELTTEYFKGRQQSYVHPVRILLVSTVALIALISYAIGKGGFDDTLRTPYSKLYGSYEKAQFIHKLDSLKLDVAERFDKPGLANAAIDTLFQLANVEELKADSFSLGYEDDDIRFNALKIRVAKKDLLLLSEDELVKQYDVKGFWVQLIWKQSIRIFRKGDRITSYLIGNLLWLVVSVLLLFGIILKLFYHRRSRYYVEHLVFLMHVHAFMFVLFGLQLFFLNYFSAANIPLMFRTSLMLLAVYILLALKRYYGQSWRKTIFKFMFLNIIYMLLLGSMMVLEVLVSMALF